MSSTRIAIAGAGQAGLHLALGLQQGGCAVTLVAARTPDQVRTGPVLSTQLMYGPALALERAAGLDLWDDRTPPIPGVTLAMADPEGSRPPLTIAGSLDEPARSVDQRLKTARWLELFEERGGTVQYRALDPAGLDALARAHDLTVVATGHGSLARIFPLDAAHSPFDGPRRRLAVVYVHGAAPHPTAPAGTLRMYAFPDAGEYFVIPALTLSGPCTIVLWEAVPGGPFDRWQDRPSPQEVLDRTRELLRTHCPEEADLLAGAEPTDAGAALTGAITPVVRHPVAPVGADGRAVLGMADAVVLNDPLTGQGANNAARSAAHYLRAVLDRGEGPFDRAWMEATFASYWERARHIDAFTRMLLTRPLPDHVQRVIAAAAERPDLAHRYVNGFADPVGYRDWLMDPAGAEAVLAVTGEGRSGPAAG
ncbi:alanine-phosphoribitol ligase [Streptomyces mashuensis]|uniref:Alanine-phosphoribitol ligase n=1 Tax=Streptomyces mashuensis TaxID=33904 RepID=A0A919B9H4_9ACTN|nr:styrene monooxygenase/indole monooxygenase family protein [Streptomyces mashuensis]GHF67064.1 alanine-phosphoribitol ligase [Streptomyces mashuensis]